MSLRSFNCPHTKCGHKGARNLSYKPNNVSFVCGNLVGGRERSCNNRLYFHSSFMLCFTELFIYVIDFILLATESFFSFKNITPLAKVHTVFKWKNQDSLPGIQTLIHSQSPNFMSKMLRYLFCRVFLPSKQTGEGRSREASHVRKKVTCSHTGQPRESKAVFAERCKKGLSYSGVSLL